MNFFERMYARQEYLTPGAAETVEVIADATASGARILDIASGKGEAACVLAERDRNVVALDAVDAFLRYSREKAQTRGIADHIGFVRGDGRRVPFADGAFDAAYCIGAPSLVGLKECVQELARVTRSGGVVIVSDIVWHTLPAEALGPEWGWVADFGQITSGEYTASLEDAGLVVDDVRVFGHGAWDAYHAPMLLVAAEERQRGDGAFAARVESGAAIEQRAARAFLDYAAFRCHRP